MVFGFSDVETWILLLGSLLVCHKHKLGNNYVLWHTFLISTALNELCLWTLSIVWCLKNKKIKIKNYRQKIKTW